MNLGNRLLNLRKQKGLSQEELADKLGVSRQTISKWETDQSLPDFDKILPLCDIFEISSDELLRGNTKENKGKIADLSYALEKENREKRARYIATGILLYSIATALFMLPASFIEFDPALVVFVFIIVCGTATYMIVYGNMVYRKSDQRPKRQYSKVKKSVIGIITMLATAIYIVVSFATFAWHITWIIWLIYAAVVEIVRLLFLLKEDKNEE